MGNGLGGVMNKHNDYNEYYQWWFDKVEQSLLYQKQYLQSQLDFRNQEQSKLIPFPNVQDKRQMDAIASLYVDLAQEMYTSYFDQISLVAEWSERLAHMAEKMMGIKSYAL